MTLLEELKSDLIAGLTRKAATTCAQWSENYVVLGNPIPGPLRFDLLPWTREMHNCNSNWVGMKSAQMGFTQTVIDRALFTLDIKAMDVLYILPKRSPDASDFSKAKFDPILEMSPYINRMFSNTRNIGHKQAGASNLYIRGARSRSGLKSISVALQIYDEFDEMPVKNIALAEQRSAGYQTDRKQKIKLSTPTVPDFGISAEFNKSNQQHFIFRCYHCEKLTELIFPDCLKVTADSITQDKELRRSYIFCNECKKPLDHSTKQHWLKGAKWSATANKDAYTQGFYINKLYSVVSAPWETAAVLIKAQTDPTEEQELYNSEGGLPHIVEGARINAQEIANCIGNHSKKDLAPSNQLVTMGVDVGKWIHFTISQWLLPKNLGPDLNTNAIKKILFESRVTDFEQLDTYIQNYQILYTVIDANPEHRKAFELAQRFLGHISLCYFTRGIAGKYLNQNNSTLTIGVDRTSWLDLSQGRFKKGRKGIILPSDTSEEFKSHIKSLVRIQKKDPDGNPVSKYISVGADHFGLANVYDELALPLAVSMSQNQNVNTYI